MGAFSTGFGIGAALHSRRAQRKEFRENERHNATARGLTDCGIMSASSLLAGRQKTIAFCADKKTREVMAAGQISFALSNGIPTVALCESAYDLASALLAEGVPATLIEIIDGYSTTYEPLAKRAQDEAVDIATEAVRTSTGAPPEARLYIDSLITILACKGVRPYIRMLDACPHGRLHEVIGALETSGIMSALQAADVRSNLDVAPACRAAVQSFFHGSVIEAPFLADKNELAISNSITELASSQTAKAIVFEVRPGSSKFIVPLLMSEVGLCVAKGIPLNLVFCASAIDSWNTIVKNIELVNNVAWSIQAEDALGFFNDEKHLIRWLSACDRLVVFSQPPASSEELSRYFGEYDKDEMSITSSSNNSIGRFGYHFAGTGGLAISVKRERVIKPEEIRNLRQGSFYATEKQRPGVLHGTTL